MKVISLFNFCHILIFVVNMLVKIVTLNDMLVVSSVNQGKIYDIDFFAQKNKIAVKLKIFFWGGVLKQYSTYCFNA